MSAQRQCVLKQRSPVAMGIPLANSGFPVSTWYGVAERWIRVYGRPNPRLFGVLSNFLSCLRLLFKNIGLDHGGAAPVALSHSSLKISCMRREKIRIVLHVAVLSVALGGRRHSRRGRLSPQEEAAGAVCRSRFLDSPMLPSGALGVGIEKETGSNRLLDTVKPPRLTCLSMLPARPDK